MLLKKLLNMLHIPDDIITEQMLEWQTDFINKDSGIDCNQSAKSIENL